MFYEFVRKMHDTKQNSNLNFKNLPPTYMEQFCRALHPDLDLSPTCISWFRQATDHCTTLITSGKSSGSYFWTTVKNFIFAERHTGLIDQKIPISIHPNRLSVQDCHALFLDIVNDYILRAPRYSAEATTNALLWQILYSLLGIMALGSLMVSTIFAYRRFSMNLQKEPSPDPIFTPAARALAYINRNVRMAKYELQRLRVQHLAQPEEIFAPDGTMTLVIKVASQLKFVDGVVASNIHSTGRLYRMHDPLSRKKAEYKTETVPKVMRYLNNYSRKLRVLFVFDEDPLYEELLRKRKKSPPFSPPRCAMVTSPKTHATGDSRPSSPTLKASPVSPRQPTQIPRNFPRRSSVLSLRKCDEKAGHKAKKVCQEKK